MTNTTMLHVRIDTQIKTQAAEALAATGLSVSDAVRVFMARVVAEQKLPFALSEPNIDTRGATAKADGIAPTRRDRCRATTQLGDIVGLDATCKEKKESARDKCTRTTKSKVAVTDKKPVIYGKYLDREILIPRGVTVLPKALLRRMAKKMGS